MISHAVVAALLLTPLVVAAQACSSEIPDGKRIESERFSLGFRTRPAKIIVGQHFMVEFVVCPKGAVTALQSVRVDAHMPAHRHGMNYTAVVSLAEGGRYLAQGLMFHMPGHWEFVFDLRAGEKTDRLSQSVLLE